MRRLLSIVLVLASAACGGESPPAATCPCTIAREAGAPAVTSAVTATTFTEPAPEAPPPVDPDQKFADLGACRLDSGQVIEHCRIGYRTFGTLDEKKSNAVLWPTWFTGTTKNLVGLVPDKLVDTKKLYLILVDAIGDGVSTSASNSTTQPRLSFPVFTIHDMVESQRRLLTETLGISHLRAVGGISMGGMQTIEWAVSQPDFMDKIIPIVGSPQLTSNDLLLWTAELHALEADPAYDRGNYHGRPQLRAVSDIHMLALASPAFRAMETKREKFRDFLTTLEADTSFDWNDWHRQLEAMIAHDVTKPYGGTMEGAAKRIRAKALFVVADQDHMVSPLPSRALAKAMGASAKVVALEGPCGHMAPDCEPAKMNAAVTAFLAQ